MITFLPTRTFTVCAKSLDDQRLIAQVGEAKAILLSVLEGKQVGVPAFDMWRQHPGHLAIYGKIFCDERHLRFGTPVDPFFAQHIPFWFWELSLAQREGAGMWNTAIDPWWLGDRRLHLSHIRRLYEKDTTYYSNWRPIRDIPPIYCCIGCDYWWPTHVRQNP